MSCKSFVLYYCIKRQLSPLCLWYGRFFALTYLHANLMYLLCVAITTFTNCRKSRGNSNMNCVYILPLGHDLCCYLNRVRDIIQHVQTLLPPKDKLLWLHSWRNCLTCAHPINTTKMRLVVYTKCLQHYSTCYRCHMYIYIELELEGKREFCFLLHLVYVTFFYMRKYQNFLHLKLCVVLIISQHQCTPQQAPNITYLQHWVNTPNKKGLRLP